MGSRHLASNVAVLFLRKNIPINKFERFGGLKRSAAANILSGKSKIPTIDILLTIANKINCSIDSLIDSKQPQQKIYLNQSSNQILFKHIGKEILDKITNDSRETSFKEIYFYAINGKEYRFKDKYFLSRTINSHFPKTD